MAPSGVAGVARAFTGSRVRLSPASRAMLLGAIVVIAFLLRFLRLDHGLPEYIHPEEETILKTALAVADPESPSFRPYTFSEPSLHFYVTGAVFRVYNALAEVVGLERAGMAGMEEVVVALRVARVVSVIYSTLSVIVIHAIGRSLFSTRAGLLAALFLAVAPLAVLRPQQASLDTPLVFFGLLSAFFAARYVNERKPSWFLASAAAVGLAASTRYSGALFFSIPVFCIIVDLHDAHWERAPRAVRWTFLQLLGGVAIALFFFLAGTPYLVLEWEGYEALAQKLLARPEEASDLPLSGIGLVDRPYLYPMVGLQSFGAGILLFLAGVGGFVLGWSRPRRRLFLPFIAWLVFFLGTCWVPEARASLAAPLLPWLLLAGAGWADSQLALGRRGPMVLSLAGVVYAGVMSATLVDDWSPPTAARAVRWLGSELPSARLALGVTDPGLEEALARGQYGAIVCQPALGWLERVRPEVVLFDSRLEDSFRRDPERFRSQVDFFDALHSGRAGYELVQAFEASYFSEGLYRLIDRDLGNPCGMPDYYVFVRE